MAEEKTTPPPVSEPPETPKSSQSKQSTDTGPSAPGYGEKGKGSVMKWIVIYLIIAAVIYGAIYLLT